MPDEVGDAVAASNSDALVKEKCRLNGLPVVIEKKPDDPMCARVSMGGDENSGYYIVYRNDIESVLKVFQRCHAVILERAADLKKKEAALKAVSELDVFCKRCNAKTDTYQGLTPEGPHYGKLMCRKCGSFFAWLPYPVLPIDDAKLPKHPPGALLPVLVGKSQSQIAFGERCREQILSRLAGVSTPLKPELYNAMLTIADATWWIGNRDRAAVEFRWPAAWS